MQPPLFVQIQWNALPREVREYFVRAQVERSPYYHWFGPAQRESAGPHTLLMHGLAVVVQVVAATEGRFGIVVRLAALKTKDWFRHAGRVLRRARGARSVVPDPRVAAAPGAFTCAVLLPAGLALFMAWGYGDAQSAWLWRGPVVLAFYVAAVGLCVWGALQLARASWVRPRRDYSDGFPLFSSAVVEFRGTCIRVRRFTPTDGVRNEPVRYGPRKVSHKIYERYKNATITHNQYHREPTHFRIAFMFDDRDFDFPGRYPRLSAFDPLEGLLTHPAWPSMQASGAAPALPPPADGGPACGVSRRAPWLLRLPVAFIALVAALVGAGLWLARNDASDTEGYAAIARNDVLGYEGYVAHGWLHREEAQEALDYLRYTSRAWPSLQEFVRRHPRHPKVPEARATLHRHFGQAGVAYEAQSAPENPSAASFVRRALAFQERSGSPPVVVRFARPDAAALAAFDAETHTIARLRAESPVALAPQFTDVAMRPREHRVVENLQDAFHEVFPDGIFHLDDSGRDAPTASPSVRFEVSYAPSPTGAHMAGWGDGRRAPGARFDFRVIASVPDGGPVFMFLADVPPTLGVLDHGTANPAREFPVGPAVCDRAFARFSSRLRGAFFRPRPRAPGGADERDEAPSTGVADVSGTWNVTLTRVDSTQPAPARLTLERRGAIVTGSYRSAHGGHRVADGTLQGTMSGQQLLATCVDADGVTGPCAFEISDDGAELTAMTTVGAARTYWLGRDGAEPARVIDARGNAHEPAPAERTFSDGRADDPPRRRRSDAVAHYRAALWRRPQRRRARRHARRRARGDRGARRNALAPYRRGARHGVRHRALERRRAESARGPGRAGSIPRAGYPSPRARVCATPFTTIAAGALAGSVHAVETA